MPEEQGQEGAAGRGEASGEQPQAGGELASTGFDVGVLGLIGGLCVGAALVLFRRRKTA